eukprot:gene7103-14448_t
MTSFAPCLAPSVGLRNGSKIPCIGLGVYESTPGEECYTAVSHALRAGYRHVDTAQIYNNESDVGRAVEDSQIPRNEIFITTKLWLSNFGYEQAIDSVKISCAKLRSQYIDLLLLHAPGEPGLRAETWRALEDLQVSGVLKSIGVSNFGIPHLEKLAETAKIPPSINQIELHPWLQRPDLVQYCLCKGILVQAYSPLAKSTKLSDPVVCSIAESIGATTAQVLLAWSLAKGYVTLPKSVNPSRQISNLLSFTVTLNAEHMLALDNLNEDLVTGWDPIKTAPV